MPALNPGKYAEPAFWLIALVLLFFTDPGAPPLLDLCAFKWLGLACPGCGLGHGIAHLLDLDFQAAIAAHPLSPFALAFLTGRILTGIPGVHRTPAVH